MLGSSHPKQMQKIIIIGHLGKDVELRYTSQGVAVADFTIASTYKEETTWFKVSVWREQAENCAKFLSKGKQVYVEGPLSVEEWKDRDGKDRFSLKIDANTVQFLGAKDETPLADEEASPEKHVATKGKGAKVSGTKAKAPKADIPF